MFEALAVMLITGIVATLVGLAVGYIDAPLRKLNRHPTPSLNISWSLQTPILVLWLLGFSIIGVIRFQLFDFYLPVRTKVMEPIWHNQS